MTSTWIPWSVNAQGKFPVPDDFSAWKSRKAYQVGGKNVDEDSEATEKDDFVTKSGATAIKPYVNGRKRRDDVFTARPSPKTKINSNQASEAAAIKTFNAFCSRSIKTAKVHVAVAFMSNEHKLKSFFGLSR